MEEKKDYNFGSYKEVENTSNNGDRNSDDAD